jgi:hypothetical protein
VYVEVTPVAGASDQDIDRLLSGISIDNR